MTKADFEARLAEQTGMTKNAAAGALNAMLGIISDELLKGIRESRRVEKVIADVELTAVTIREKAVDRAIEARAEGWGPDRILMMVSTSGRSSNSSSPSVPWPSTTS